MLQKGFDRLHYFCRHLKGNRGNLQLECNALTAVLLCWAEFCLHFIGRFIDLEGCQQELIDFYEQKIDEVQLLPWFDPFDFEGCKQELIDFSQLKISQVQLLPKFNCTNYSLIFQKKVSLTLKAASES